MRRRRGIRRRSVVLAGGKAGRFCPDTRSGGRKSGLRSGEAGECAPDRLEIGARFGGSRGGGAGLLGIAIAPMAAAMLALFVQTLGVAVLRHQDGDPARALEFGEDD